MSLHPPARAAPAARRETERNVDFRGRTMRILPLGCALLLLASAGTAAGSDVNVDCDVHSDYDFALTSRSLILTREEGAPKTGLMSPGRLFIDVPSGEGGAAERKRGA